MQNCDSVGVSRPANNLSQEARGELVLGVTNFVKKLVGRSSVPKNEREDFIQECMFELLRQAPKYDSSKGMFTTFTNQVVVRLIKGKHRDSERSPFLVAMPEPGYFREPELVGQVDDAESDDETYADVVGDETVAEVATLFQDGLTATQTELFHLFAVERLNVDQAAVRLGQKACIVELKLKGLVRRLIENGKLPGELLASFSQWTAANEIAPARKASRPSTYRQNRDRKERLKAERLAKAGGVVQTAEAPAAAEVQPIVQKSKPGKPSRTIEVRGRSMTLEQASDEFGVPVQVLRSRLLSGWHPDRAIETQKIRSTGEPLPSSVRTIEVFGRTMTVTEASKEFGLRPATIYSRLQNGRPVEEAVGARARRREQPFEVVEPSPEEIERARLEYETMIDRLEGERLRIGLSYNSLSKLAGGICPGGLKKVLGRKRVGRPRIIQAVAKALEIAGVGAEIQPAEVEVAAIPVTVASQSPGPVIIPSQQQPLPMVRTIRVNGVAMSPWAASEKFGVPLAVVLTRLRQGLDETTAATLPAFNRGKQPTCDANKGRRRERDRGGWNRFG